MTTFEIRSDFLRSFIAVYLGPFFLGMGPLGSMPDATTWTAFPVDDVFWQGTDRALWYGYDLFQDTGWHGPTSAGMGPLG